MQNMYMHVMIYTNHPSRKHVGRSTFTHQRTAGKAPSPSQSTCARRMRKAPMAAQGAACLLQDAVEIHRKHLLFGLPPLQVLRQPRQRIPQGRASETLSRRRGLSGLHGSVNEGAHHNVVHRKGEEDLSTAHATEAPCQMHATGRHLFWLGFCLGSVFARKRSASNACAGTPRRPGNFQS